jgi:hypothetical protein
MEKINDTSKCPFCNADIESQGSSTHVWDIKYKCGCKLYGALDIETHGDDIEIETECPSKSKTNMKEIIPPTFLICDCGLSEHQIIIYKDKDFANGYREVILNPHLVTYKNFFKRCIVAIKYVFGYKSKYGAWDSMIITKRNYQPLKDAITFLEN